MKNLKQNLVKAILCLGVVSVSLVACQSDEVESADVLTLDQLDDVINDVDSAMQDTTAVADDDTVMYEPVDNTESMVEDVEKEEK